MRPKSFIETKRACRYCHGSGEETAYILDCRNCSKTFKTTQKLKRFCSKECYHVYRKKRERKNARRKRKE